MTKTRAKRPPRKIAEAAAPVNAEVLPSKGSENLVWEKIGIKFGARVDGDNMFRHAVLPAGWKKVGTDHSTCGPRSLTSTAGSERGSSTRRPTTTARRSSTRPAASTPPASPRGGYGLTYVPDRKYFAVVKDANVEIWRSSEPFEAKGDRGPGYESSYDHATARAQAHLAERYPNWKDPTAHWDEP